MVLDSRQASFAYRTGWASVLFILIFPTILTIQWIEREFLPVIQEWEFTDVMFSSSQASFGVSFNKVRDCDLESITYFVVLGRNRNNRVPFPSIEPKQELDIGRYTPDTRISLPRLAALPGDRPFDFGVSLRFKCHVFWPQTETEFYHVDNST